MEKERSLKEILSSFVPNGFEEPKKASEMTMEELDKLTGEIAGDNEEGKAEIKEAIDKIS